MEEENLSPSKMLQTRIDEMMTHGLITPKMIKELNRKVDVWKNISIKFRDFLDKKDMLEEFQKNDG